MQQAAVPTVSPVLLYDTGKVEVSGSYNGVHQGLVVVYDELDLATRGHKPGQRGRKRNRTIITKAKRQGTIFSHSSRKLRNALTSNRAACNKCGWAI